MSSSHEGPRLSGCRMLCPDNVQHRLQCFYQNYTRSFTGMNKIYSINKICELDHSQMATCNAMDNSQTIKTLYCICPHSRLYMYMYKIIYKVYVV